MTFKEIRRKYPVMQVGFASFVTGGLIAGGVAVFRVSFLAGTVMLVTGGILGLLCMESASKYDAELNL